MARQGRFYLPGQALHLIQRGNNRQAIFRDDEDCRTYLSWLAEAASVSRCTIHAYVLMTNHVHLLVTPENADSVPRMMQLLGRRYVRYFNTANHRTGTLWEGRYRAAPIDTDAYFLLCCRYIELNPVRAKMVTRPRDYRWSSYRTHAHGIDDPVLTTHPLYGALGRSQAERQAFYRGLFREALDKDFIDELRSSTNGGWPLGGVTFKAKITAALKRRVAPLPPGPKPAPTKDKSRLRLL